MNAKNYFTIVCRKNQGVKGYFCDIFLNFLTSFPKFCLKTNSVRKNFSKTIDIKENTCYTVSILLNERRRAECSYISSDTSHGKETAFSQAQIFRPSSAFKSGQSRYIYSAPVMPTGIAGDFFVSICKRRNNIEYFHTTRTEGTDRRASQGLRRSEQLPVYP